MTLSEEFREALQAELRPIMDQLLRDGYELGVRDASEEVAALRQQISELTARAEAAEAQLDVTRDIALDALDYVSPPGKIIATYRAVRVEEPIRESQGDTQ